MHIETFCGKEIAPWIDALGELRIRIFSEYPYLYQGEIAGERRYLIHYSNAESGRLTALFDEAHNLVGAATGLDCSAPWIDDSLRQFATDNSQKVFYWGELILDSACRNRGLGETLYQTLEAQLIKEGYSAIVLSMIQTEKNDPRKPPAYREMDGFVTRHGYTKIAGSQTVGEWVPIGGEGMEGHRMAFWRKGLLG